MGKKDQSIISVLQLYPVVVMVVVVGVLFSANHAPSFSARDLLVSDNNSRQEHSYYFNPSQAKTSTTILILQTTRDTHLVGLNVLDTRTRDRIFQTKPIKEPRSAAYWLFAQCTDGPGVRMAETTEGGGDGSLFQGKQFWLSQNIPQRSRFKELIAVSLISIIALL